jgi:hypothetical protein
MQHSMRMSSRFGEWALTACEHDPIAFERFFKVSNLIDPDPPATPVLRVPRG